MKQLPDYQIHHKTHTQLYTALSPFILLKYTVRVFAYIPL